MMIRYQYQDHPRVCGEKQHAGRQAFCTTGSPPRVRGKGMIDKLVREKMRITPACAGKSSESFGIISAYRDHPRVCGEKSQ